MTLNVIFMFIIDVLLCTFIFRSWLRKGILKGKSNLKKIANVLFLLVLFMIVGGILNYILLTRYVIHVNSLLTAGILLITIIGIYLIGKVLRNKN